MKNGETTCPYPAMTVSPHPPTLSYMQDYCPSEHFLLPVSLSFRSYLHLPKKISLVHTPDIEIFGLNGYTEVISENRVFWSVRQLGQVMLPALHSVQLTE